MVTLVKHEWHQVDSQYALEIDEDLLREIYPDSDDDEISNLLQELESGDADIDQILNDAWDNDVDIEWEHQYDDWWTSRKGGYDITYEYGDDDSWHTSPAPALPTHKCTKCKWEGQGYETDYVWPEDDSGEQDPKKICPMCESDTELTEEGIKEEEERKEREARWAAMDAEESDDSEMSAEEMQSRLEELKQEFEKIMIEEEKKNEG